MAGLNTARPVSGTTEINPVIGVRSQRIEEMLAETMGEPFHKYIPPTFSRNIGYVTPLRKYWAVFANWNSISTAATELANAVRLYGLPFVTQLSDVKRLTDVMRYDSLGITEPLKYRVPL